MSIQEIVNFIKNKQYIYDDKICYSHYFRGDNSDYQRCGNMYISILEEAFENHYEITDSSIIIYHNNLWFHISYLKEIYNIFWNISINDNYNSLNRSGCIKNLY
jgi:hypothetical protein